MIKIIEFKNKEEMMKYAKDVNYIYKTLDDGKYYTYHVSPTTMYKPLNFDPKDLSAVFGGIEYLSFIPNDKLKVEDERKIVTGMSINNYEILAELYENLLDYIDDNLTNPILGHNYYNMGCDTNSVHRFLTEDLRDKYFIQKHHIKLLTIFILVLMILLIIILLVLIPEVL